MQEGLKYHAFTYIIQNISDVNVLKCKICFFLNNINAFWGIGVGSVVTFDKVDNFSILVNDS